LREGGWRDLADVSADLSAEALAKAEASAKAEAIGPDNTTNGVGG
jgi:hypothetical protein